MTAKRYLHLALGGNMNISKLTLNFWYEIMIGFAKRYHKSQLKPQEGESKETWNSKPNIYDQDGILQDIGIGDFIVTKSGIVREITHDDMPDLHYNQILRFATKKEVNYLPPKG